MSCTSPLRHRGCGIGASSGRFDSSACGSAPSGCRIDTSVAAHAGLLGRGQLLVRHDLRRRQRRLFGIEHPDVLERRRPCTIPSPGICMVRCLPSLQSIRRFRIALRPCLQPAIDFLEPVVGLLAKDIRNRPLPTRVIRSPLSATQAQCNGSGSCSCTHPGEAHHRRLHRSRPPNATRYQVIAEAYSRGTAAHCGRAVGPLQRLPAEIAGVKAE